MASGTTGSDLPLPGGRSVPASLVHLRALPAGGPGGQHANRSSTRVVASVCVDDLPLTERELALVRTRLANRISDAGVLSASAGERRSQLQNRTAALARLADLIAGALEEQAPRRPTRVPRGVRERRLHDKARRSQTKRARRPPGGPSGASEDA